MKKAIILSSVVFLFSGAGAGVCRADTAKISQVSGTADIRSADTDIWYAAQSGAKVKSGQAVKTKPRSRVKIELEDGSKIEIRPNSKVNLDDLKGGAPAVSVMVGRLKAWVSKNMNRSKFEVKTPVAVCSVRGTEFDISVAENGETDVEVYGGLVGVRKADGTGEEIPVGAGEKLSISIDKPITNDMKSEAGGARNEVRREVGLEMSKEAVQAAAAEEMRLAEYQEGKTMVDAFGFRVRLEEYIMRPAADTFKLVVLNERDSRFDYFYYKGTFNTTLPSDLSVALRDMSGKLGSTAPDYYLTGYEQAYSNTQDYSRDTAAGGHLVKITYNGNGTFTLTDNADAANTRIVDAYNAANGAYNPLTDIFDTTQTGALTLTVFNPASDAFETFSAGQTFWKTRFNTYEHALNDVRKQWYLRDSSSRNTLAMDLDGSWLYPALDTANNIIYGEWGVSSTASTYPDPAQLHNRIKITYHDGTYEQYDNYIISDDGKIALSSDFNGITSGTQYKEELLKWNYEQVLTATEFGGRKIDLVVEPKILIKSGIIK